MTTFGQEFIKQAIYVKHGGKDAFLNDKTNKKMVDETISKKGRSTISQRWLGKVKKC